jgi:hypothetical protein
MPTAAQAQDAALGHRFARPYSIRQDRSMTEPPLTIPAGLRVELSRAKVKPGMGDEADRWMKMLNDRADECVASLDRERVAIEIVFRLNEDGVDYLYWMTVAGHGGEGLDLTIPIDRDHNEIGGRVKEPGWVEAEPQVLLLPAPVRAAVMQWALRPAN